MPKKKDDLDIILEDNNCVGTLIFLHGLGGEGSSWRFFANEIKKYIKNIRIILPTASENKISAFGKIKNRSWFDITEFPITENYIDNGNYIDYSLDEINKLINQEIEKGIMPNKIFLGGFSQGAAMSLIVAMKNQIKLGGVLMLSGWIFKNTDLLDNKTDLPIFIGHGDNDKVVLYENALNLDKVLSKSGITDLTIKRYKNMGHNTSTKEINDAIEWLSLNLAKRKF